MKAQLPHPEHLSYLKHQKQRMTHIILPVAISAVLMLALVVLICLSTFNSGGDVARWAEISTIWIVIPIMFGGLIVFALLAALIYGMARLLQFLPHYTGIAQDYVYLARGYVVRGTEAVTSALIEAEGFTEKIRSFIQRIVP